MEARLRRKRKRREGAASSMTSPVLDARSERAPAYRAQRTRERLALAPSAALRSGVGGRVVAGTRLTR
jgi:hypothetical protein